VRSGEEGREKVRERSLGKVSVVQIARAVLSQASCVEARVECAVGMRSRILEIGRLVGGLLVSYGGFLGVSYECN
jgi:hypothetical protein